MKKILLNLTAILLLIGLSGTFASAQVVVNLRQLDNDDAFIADIGTAGAISVPVGEITVTHSFTVTDLDIAGDGTANDVGVFSYDVTATNGNVAVIDSRPDGYGVDGVDDPEDNEVDPEEGLRFDNLNAEVTFGDPTTETLTIVSAGFNFFFTRFPGNGDMINLTDANGDPISITTTPDGGSEDFYRFENLEPTFSILSTAGNGFGVDNLNATFTLQLGSAPFLLGDVNLDGTINFLDIAPFISILSSNEFQAEADADLSGQLNFADIAPFIAILSSQ